jgi:hypothetical protein
MGCQIYRYKRVNDDNTKGMKKDELIKRLYTHKIIGDKDLMQILEEAGFKDYAISSIINKIADITNAPLPPAEGAEAIVKKYEDEYDFKFHWVQRDRVIRMMREFAAQQQPTAEGAEEIEAELRGYARDIVRLHKPIMEVNPQLAMDSIGNDLVKMFNRLAQRLADKMVSERLREELIRYIKWYGGFNYENMTDEMLVNEYLKSRDSHE